MSSNDKDARWEIAMRTCKEVTGKDMADPRFSFHDRQSMLTGAQMFVSLMTEEQKAALVLQFNASTGVAEDGTDMSWTELARKKAAEEMRS